MIVKMYTGYLENGILGIDYEILSLFGIDTVPVTLSYQIYRRDTRIFTFVQHLSP